MNANAPSTKEHPVWDVYDLLRTAKLNIKYYSAKTEAVRRRNLALEIVLGIAVPSSALAGMDWFQTRYGHSLWSVCLVIGSVLAVAKPFLRLEDTIESYASCVARFRDVCVDLEDLRTEISQKQTYDIAMKEKFKGIRARMHRVVQGEPVEPVDNDLRSKMENQVKGEFPKSAFFVP